MAKRDLRESMKSEIANLFKSPERAEEDFQQATKRKRPSSQSPSVTKCDEEPGKPKLGLCLSRLYDGQRIDCEDLASFAHYCIFGSMLQKPKWISLSNLRNVLQTLIIRINVEEEFFETTNLPFCAEFFEKKWVELAANISDRNLFWHSLMNVRLSLQEQIRRKSVKMQKTFDTIGKHDRSHFILSLEQLADKNYPFPGDDGIVPTKKKYKKVSPNSPLFSVDCEMCETSNANRALTRISIVNEQGDTVLDTLVKPDGYITDYVTQFSGITAKMMKGVTTTLEDVQTAVQSLLPPDAILVGHSLEYDLQAMKMAHPYCLDVGQVLNYTNGNSGLRNSLKNLSELFLGESIQSAYGHCSYEDAWAALRLAQLKLKNGIVFGNTSFGWKYTEYAKRGDEVYEEKKEIQSKQSCSGCSQPTVVECTVRNCRCRFVSVPDKCVRCIREGQNEQGDFDWAQSLPVERDKTASPIATYLKKDKMRSVMCAFDRDDLDLMDFSSKKIRYKTPSTFPAYERFLDDVASGMLNDSVVLLEIDKEKLAAPSEGAEGEIPDNADVLDEKLEKLVAATTKNSLIMMIFSSCKKNILYVRVK